MDCYECEKDLWKKIRRLFLAKIWRFFGEKIDLFGKNFFLSFWRLLFFAFLFNLIIFFKLFPGLAEIATRRVQRALLGARNHHLQAHHPGRALPQGPRRQELRQLRHPQHGQRHSCLPGPRRLAGQGGRRRGPPPHDRQHHPPARRARLSRPRHRRLRPGRRAPSRAAPFRLLSGRDTPATTKVHSTPGRTRRRGSPAPGVEGARHWPPAGGGLYAGAGAGDDAAAPNVAVFLHRLHAGGPGVAAQDSAATAERQPADAALVSHAEFGGQVMEEGRKYRRRFALFSCSLALVFWFNPHFLSYRVVLRR